MPRKKQGYFDAILNEGLSLSDRVIALDIAVGAMHIEFSVPRGVDFVSTRGEPVSSGVPATYGFGKNWKTASCASRWTISAKCSM